MRPNVPVSHCMLQGTVLSEPAFECLLVIRAAGGGGPRCPGPFEFPGEGEVFARFDYLFNPKYLAVTSKAACPLVGYEVATLPLVPCSWIQGPIDRWHSAGRQLRQHPSARCQCVVILLCQLMDHCMLIAAAIPSSVDYLPMATGITFTDVDPGYQRYAGTVTINVPFPPINVTTYALFLIGQNTITQPYTDRVKVMAM